MARGYKSEGIVAGAVVLGALALLATASSRPRVSQQRANELHGLMIRQLARVARVVGVAAPELRADYSVANANASGNLIRYNPLWIEAKLKQHCNDSACVVSIVVGVLAHELSHILHADRYTTSVAHNHGMELRADRLAGWVLAQLSHDSDDVEKVWREFVAMNSPTHPPAPHRIEALSMGFWHARSGYYWA